MCLVLSYLMYPFLNCSIHAAFFSSKNRCSASTTEERLQVLRICPTIALRQKHSKATSCKVSISAWFEEMETKDYLVDLRDVAVPLTVKT